MRALAIALVVLIILGGAGFGYYYNESTKRESALRAEAGTTKEELSSLRGQIERMVREMSPTAEPTGEATAEAGDLMKAAESARIELSSIKESVTRLEQELAAARASLQSAAEANAGHVANVARLEQELSASGDALKAATEARTSVERSREATAGFLKLYVDAQRLANDRVPESARNANAAEQSLVGAPGPDKYKEHEQKLRALRVQCVQARSALERVEKFTDENAADLQYADSLVSEVTSRAKTAATTIQQMIDRVDRSLASRREVRYAVLANESWQPSRATVAQGELIAMSSTGQWRWGASIGSAVGAAGENAGENYRAISNYPTGALMLRIRGSETVHPGWASAAPDRPGDVEFRINDTQVADNKGSLDVTMWIFLPLGAP